ncbi:SIMPL domain-containing protein [Rufibacter psychrotolerans]|uniref:SIMPL domain-containing protein n=1 Tax=Rufibacter psychrotolerans TaxID=2812556 RepID=UPI001F088114|nr:SIMPL domain-containing protein [Rufibacter sp. SYSU D00308]
MKTILPFVFAMLLSFSSSLGYAQQHPLPPLVNTSGLGEVKVQPDQLTFRVGVEIREKTLDETRKAADQRTAALISFLKKSGIDDKDVQTENLSVYPIYSGPEYGQTAPQSFQATRTISVTLKKLNRFDELMTGLYKAGANRVDGITYETTQLKKHQEEARRKAVQDAKQKAVLLASELGSKVGRPYQINESGNGGPRPVLYAKAAMREMSAMDAGGPTIALGEITITSTVEVSFLLE